ncbi:MAG: class I SAM-dependent methyltransferase [Candidatus Bathyarchaeum sp.]|nr:MAG: class I SAM-dependent methyltransferase [Candidatus Bathyarchaeum sp.]
MVHKLTYYKVKKPSDLIPNYLDYVRNQIEESYVPGKIVPLAKHLEPKVEPIKIEVHKSDVKPPKKKMIDNTRFTLEKFKNIDRNKSILDCACGGGGQMQELRKLGFKNVAGIELSSKFVITTKNADVAYGGVKADMHWVPFRDGVFDVVTSFHTIEHSYYPAKLLQEFWRVIKPKGRLFVILPYPDSGHENDFHVAKYMLGTNILDQGKSVIKFFEANGFYVTIAERSCGLVNEPVMWLQFRKRLYKRGKPYKPWEDN